MDILQTLHFIAYCVSFQTACVFCITVKQLSKRKEKIKEPNCPDGFDPRNSACINCDCSIDCRLETKKDNRKWDDIYNQKINEK